SVFEHLLEFVPIDLCHHGIAPSCCTADAAVITAIFPENFVAMIRPPPCRSSDANGMWALGANVSREQLHLMTDPDDRSPSRCLRCEIVRASAQVPAGLTMSTTLSTRSTGFLAGTSTRRRSRGVGLAVPSPLRPDNGDRVSGGAR